MMVIALSARLWQCWTAAMISVVHFEGWKTSDSLWHRY